MTASPAEASFFIGGGPQWLTSSLRPVPSSESLSSRNSGYGMELKTGYALMGWLEPALAIDYVPLARGSTPWQALSSEHLFAYGLSMGVRLEDSVYFGVSYEPSRYVVQEALVADGSFESSRWQGALIGLRFGGSWEISERGLMEVAVRYRKGDLKLRDRADVQPEFGERTVDTFALSVTYLRRSPIQRGRSPFFR